MISKQVRACRKLNKEVRKFKRGRGPNWRRAWDDHYLFSVDKLKAMIKNKEI